MRKYERAGYECPSSKTKTHNVGKSVSLVFRNRMGIRFIDDFANTVVAFFWALDTRIRYVDKYVDDTLLAACISGGFIHM